jgi:hypothetical protein
MKSEAADLAIENPVIKISETVVPLKMRNKDFLFGRKSHII